MGTIPVRPVDASDAALVDEVQRTFRNQHTLADLLRWAAGQSAAAGSRPPLASREAIASLVTPPAF